MCLTTGDLTALLVINNR